MRATGFLSGSAPARAVHALDDTTLAVAAGASLSLVGPSGSGKSIRLMATAGLERPSQSRITVAGTLLFGLAGTFRVPGAKAAPVLRNL